MKFGHLRMQRNSLLVNMKYPLFAALLAVIAAGCSSQSDVKGMWTNSDSSTLELKADSVAIMGQTGLEGDVKGVYWMDGDTVWVKSPLDSNVSAEVYNLFTLHHSNDSLYLVRIALYRGSDFQSLEGEEFAKRLGKSPGEMAFVRMTGGSK
jgi:hypothetical protein